MFAGLFQHFFHNKCEYEFVDSSLAGRCKQYFFGQKLIDILRNSSPITVRGGPPLTEEEEKEEGEKETEVHCGKAMKKKPSTVSCQSVHDFFITDSPEPVDVCNQKHAWLVTSVVSNRGVVTTAPFVLSHGRKLNKFFTTSRPLPVFAHQTDAQDTLEYALSTVLLLGSRLV